MNPHPRRALIMIERLLEFLEEDLGEEGDITTESIISGETTADAVITAKEEGVVAGLEEAALLLEHFGLGHTILKRDGERVKKWEIVVEIKGNLRVILKIERLILNIISRMSGIATLTSELSAICGARGVQVMGTRKTTPGFRKFEKKAIRIGGGLPHRTGLFDGVIIKDNHLSGMEIKEAVKRARLNNPGKRIEVEVSSLEDAAEAIKAGSEIIMIDNLSPDEARAQIEALQEQGLRRAVEIELSGGINPNNIKAYARIGADRISLGALTTDAKWLDFSLKVNP
jgi:nicotinate-nucleotide pyrophosphorylase (carboxylating)